MDESLGEKPLTDATQSLAFELSRSNARASLKETRLEETTTLWHTIRNGMLHILSKGQAVTLDHSGSKNCASHTGSLAATHTLAPNEAKIFHHLFAATKGSWGYCYKLNWTTAA